MQNPYASPDSESTSPSAGITPWKAVTIGLVVDFGGTFAMSIVASIGLAVYLASTGLDPDGVAQRMAAMGAGHPVALVLSGAGLGISVLAGYVGARLVKRDERFWGMVQAGLTTAISILLTAGATPIALNVLMSVIGFAAVTLGANLGAYHNNGRLSAAEGEEYFSVR